MNCPVTFRAAQNEYIKNLVNIIICNFSYFIVQEYESYLYGLKSSLEYSKLSRENFHLHVSS